MFEGHVCADCNITVREDQWRDHLVSKKHRKNIRPIPRPVQPLARREATMAGTREVIAAFIRLDHATPEPLLPLPLRFVHRYLLSGVVPARHADYLRRRALRDARWGERQRRQAADPVAVG